MIATTGRAATAALPTLRDASAQAETAYRDAVYAAHLAGATYAELADTLGVSRQAVRQMIGRATTAEKQMTERLAAIDAWYERAIEKMMDRPGDFKRVTAFQNARAKKLGVRKYPTVRQMARDHAETIALKALEDHADDPRVKRIVAQLDEAASLRKRLTAFDDARMDF